jgi:hypothetical protein
VFVILELLSNSFIFRELYSNICVYLKAIEEQCRNHFILRYDPQLEVYVPQAMYEYRLFLSRYYQWEAQSTNQPPSTYKQISDILKNLFFSHPSRLVFTHLQA